MCTGRLSITETKRTRADKREGTLRMASSTIETKAMRCSRSTAPKEEETYLYPKKTAYEEAAQSRHAAPHHTYRIPTIIQSTKARRYEGILSLTAAAGGTSSLRAGSLGIKVMNTTPSKPDLPMRTNARTHKRMTYVGELREIKL